MSGKDKPLSYKDMVLKFGEAPDIANLMHKAIVKKGGRCSDCQHVESITAKIPPYISQALNVDCLSVKATCKLDPLRRYPQRAVTQGGLCPTESRYLRRQDKQT
jgi:hypothetical protein